MAEIEEDMAEEALAADENRKIDKPADDYQPSYQMMGDTKIAVGKGVGKNWESKRNQVLQKYKNDGVYDAWNECIRYFRNDQSAGRGDAVGDRPNRSYLARKLGGDDWSETENVVFANASALVPTLYAKNPDAELTFDHPGTEQLASCLEKLLDRLATRKASPALNLKPKGKRAVLQSLLINQSYFEVGYTHKEQSSEQAMEDLQKLSGQLAEAKDSKEVAEIEGKLMALEESIDALNPSGPWVKLRSAFDVLVDPEATLPDLSDANWVMIRDYLNTSFIQARFGKKDEHDQYMSIYKPTVVLAAGDVEGKEGIGGQKDDLALLPWNDDEAQQYGYSDTESYRKACRTEVFMVWDKITRRVYLFNAADWSWPIWVWDDPYNLSTFFPIVAQTFLTDFDRFFARSEVSYYLDQQDAINTINSEFKRVRTWAKDKIIYNKNVVKSVTDIENMLKGTGDQFAVGLDLPEDADINKVIRSLVPPSVEFLQLFDKKPIYEAIDRLSSVPAVMRGTEYKTNTTNKAIQSYESQLQTRLDEKMDAIEDAIGGVMRLVAEMCLQFMPSQQVAQIVGPEEAQHWKNMSPDEIQGSLGITIVGGSSIKPTSTAKKEQAMQMMQMMGQFASATPYSFIIALKMLSRAFNDDLNIDSADWQQLAETIMMQLQRGQSSGQGEPGAEGGQPPPEGGQEGGPPPEAGGSNPLEEMAMAIDNMPPEIRQQLGEAIANGTPIKEILAQLAGATQGDQP